jgi:hypothetical protein
LHNRARGLLERGGLNRFFAAAPVRTRPAVNTPSEVNPSAIGPSASSELPGTQLGSEYNETSDTPPVKLSLERRTSAELSV